MLFGTMKVKDHQLYIGDVGVNQLANEYGTPLYIYDEQLMDENIDTFQKYFASTIYQGTIVYASKAFLTVGMAKYIQNHGLHIDAVSEGELYTIKTSGFDMSKVIFHGNNKLQRELEMAIDYGVGYIVVDHEFELALLINIASTKKKKVHTLLRVNPGVEAHTHEYIQTAHSTSKFGISIYDSFILKDILKMYQTNEYVILDGFHCHIGSQIFGISAFQKAIEEMVQFSKKIFPKGLNLLNLGGGFGVRYVESDQVPPLEGFVYELRKVLEATLTIENYKIKEIMIEPGRAIVANAGTTLYTVGAEKLTYGLKNYVFIDGGMTDNIRPALYQAHYHAVVANKMNQSKQRNYTVAGKCCESGDLIVHNCELPIVETGDLLAVFSTGAYGYSMASNYNRMMRPAVVFVKNGTSKLIVQKETLEDLIKNDIK